jgi:ankyrin repeat protein/energy-coupling factor transporter ATP-binding protein EcfA2
LFTKKIESWKNDKFFETSAVATILDEVRNKSFVVITGPSGMGKSTIVKLVALQLQKTDDYYILPDVCPTDIEKYLDSNVKQIYIIDDICGKFSVDQSMIILWEKVNSQILDNKEFRVLGTCRSQISISNPFKNLKDKFKMTECNLLQKKFLYSKEEKLKIAACHIDEKTIKELDDKILGEYDMFPLLCMMYAASESNPGVRFFEYPLQVIKEQLDKMSEQNECCFIGLALIVVYNNKLYKHLLQNRNDQKFKDVFDDVFEDLGLINRPSKSRVLEGLQALERNYTKESESTITAIHDKIFDILSLYFGKRIPKTILTHGSRTFIAERFLFESVKEDCDELKIVIPSELEHSYFNRMVEEIENNRFYNVFKNVQVQNELYQGKFISFLSKDQTIIQKLLYNRWPLYLSAVKGCKLLVKFILEEKRKHQDMLMDKPESDMYVCNFDSDSESKSRSEYSFSKDDKRTIEGDAYRIQFKNSPMVAACEGGYIDIVQCLVENGYNIDHSDTNLPTPLFSACKYGKKDVVDFLLKKNCKVDAVNNIGEIALHAACENGNEYIVKILLKYISSVNLCSTGGLAPLHFACIYGNTDVVQILIDNDCDINKSILDPTNDIVSYEKFSEIFEIYIKHNIDMILYDMYDMYDSCSSVFPFQPIVLACLKGHTDIVKLLLDNNCHVIDNNGFSPALECACRGGSVDVVDLLLRNKCNINQCQTRTNKSLLIVACCRNQEAVAKMLLSYEACDVNITDCDNRNALHYACEKGQADVVELLLRRHCNVNLNDRWMQTPLYIACESGYVDIVKMLINQDNCMIDVLDVDGNGILHATCGISCYEGKFLINYARNSRLNATKNEYGEIIRLLLGKSCDVNVLNSKGQSVLHAACAFGETEIVDILLRNNSNVNQCDEENQTPLFIACKNGYIDIVKLLIESKCEIFNHSLNGQTVLHAVCSGRDRSKWDYLNFERFTEDHKDILTLLIDKKCEVNISDNNSQTPLHIACYKGNVALVEILLRNKCVVDQCDVSNKTPFFLACENGHKDVVKSLMNYNCNMDIRDTIGRSALHAVCTTHYMHRNEGDRVDIAELLINKKCGVYDLDDAGQSTLHAVCNLNNPGIVKLLLDNKLDVDQRDKMGETPIFNACRRCHRDVLKLLIEWKCDVNVLNINGLNALNIVFNLEFKGRRMVLFRTELKKVVKLLVDNDCSVNICDADGQTPLHRACRKGYADIAELFLKRNSNINQCNKLMKTPLILAVEGRHTKVVELLVEYKCDINICDKDGRTARDIAVENQFVDIENILLNAMKNTNAHDACTE